MTTLSSIERDASTPARLVKLHANSVGGYRRAMTFETILYAVDGPVATITLNRPEQLNTIVPPLPDEVEAAVGRAVADGSVKVIVLRGAGRSFCAGYDFGGGFKAWDDQITTDGEWDAGKDFAFATAPAERPDAEAHERVASAEARDRPGPRLVRRRRQRLRACAPTS